MQLNTTDFQANKHEPGLETCENLILRSLVASFCSIIQALCLNNNFKSLCLMISLCLAFCAKYGSYSHRLEQASNFRTFVTCQIHTFVTSQIRTSAASQLHTSVSCHRTMLTLS